jgi:hypothetical protein
MDRSELAALADRLCQQWADGNISHVLAEITATRPSAETALLAIMTHYRVSEIFNGGPSFVRALADRLGNSTPPDEAG